MTAPTFDRFTIEDLEQVLGQSMEFMDDTSQSAPERLSDAPLELARASYRHMLHLVDGVWRGITEHYGASDWTERLRREQIAYVRSIGDVPDSIMSKVGAAFRGASHADLVFHVASAVWLGEVRPRLAERKSPAVLVKVERALAVYGATVEGETIVDACGTILSDLSPGEILSGRVEGRHTDLDLLNSGTFDQALWWLRQVGHGVARANVRDAGDGWVEVAGGFAGFASSIGASSKQAESKVKPVLDLMYDLSINTDNGRFRLVEAYQHSSMARDRTKRPTVPGAKLWIKIGDICKAGFVKRFGDGTESIVAAMSPVPLESIPSFFWPRGRALERCARCYFRDNIVSAINPSSGAIVGVPMDWHALASGCGFPDDRVAAVLAEWKACSRWEEVRPGRWFPGTGEPEARALSIRSARHVLGRRLAGKRSVAVKREQVDKRLPHNPPATSPQPPGDFPTTPKGSRRD